MSRFLTPMSFDALWFRNRATIRNLKFAPKAAMIDFREARASRPPLS